MLNKSGVALDGYCMRELYARIKLLKVTTTATTSLKPLNVLETDQWVWNWNACLLNSNPRRPARHVARWLAVQVCVLVCVGASLTLNGNWLKQEWNGNCYKSGLCMHERVRTCLRLSVCAACGCLLISVRADWMSSVKPRDLLFLL